MMSYNQSTFEKTTTRTVLVSYAAMIYSCHDLGLRQQLLALEEDYEPNAKQQAHLLELVRRAKGVKKKKKFDDSRTLFRGSGPGNGLLLPASCQTQTLWIIANGGFSKGTGDCSEI